MDGGTGVGLCNQPIGTMECLSISHFMPWSPDLHPNTSGLGMNDRAMDSSVFAGCRCYFSRGSMNRLHHDGL